jgi:hypothetical protein
VGLTTITEVYSLTTTLSAGDVIQMVKVPKGATPVYVAVVGASTGVTNVNVGDGNSANRFINAYATSAAAVQQIINTAYVPYTYTADDTIDITVSAASVATVGGYVTLTAVFTMDAS